MSILLAEGMRPPEHGAASASHIHGVMTDAEYEVAREKLRATYGNSAREASALRDQALAKIFVRSGWTQEKLAEKETLLTGKKVSQPYISQRLLFGRFLNFIATAINHEIVPASLTERTFRRLWDQTDKKSPKDEYRFREVIKLLGSGFISTAKRPGIGKQIREYFADGKWHDLAVIADKIEADEAHVEATLDGMWKNGYYGCKAEKKQVGKSHAYRIFKQDRAVATSELLEKLAPIIKALEAEGKASAAAASPANVAILAGKLRKLLNEWAEPRGIDTISRRLSSASVEGTWLCCHQTKAPKWDSVY